jgi:3-oxoacyl-[acyl-carrier-protein] synthase III
MSISLDQLLAMLQAVRTRLGQEPDATPDTPFAEALDSMGMAEYLADLADELGLTVAALEQRVGRRFTTVADLARTLQQVAAPTVVGQASPLVPGQAGTLVLRPSWLCATVAYLPNRRQPAHERDLLIGRPPGWLQRHAGIRSFSCWGEEDPLTAAQQCGRACLARAGLEAREVGALVVTATAPPLLAGLGACLHHRLGLPGQAIPLEVGGGCCGFLSAVWTAHHLLSRMDDVLILSVEAPGRWLSLVPGPAGETASLFGDAAAACLLSTRARGGGARPLCEVTVRAEGGRAALLQAVHTSGRGVEIQMEGVELAAWAVETMAEQVRSLSDRQGLTPEQLAGVVPHAGNGRLPGLLAHYLDLPVERILSTTAETGNLGSASLPVAAASRAAADAVGPGTRRVAADLVRAAAAPLVLVAVGVGLLSGAALLGPAVPAISALADPQN